MKRYTEINKCRICGNANLVPILDLGTQCLSGVFPRTRDQPVTSGPLELVKCHGGNACGLLQLKQSYDPAEMYGDNYGYRSGLNRTMVDHLHAKVRQIADWVAFEPGDIVVDIGSNDGTLLQAYPRNLELVGFDPAGEKFRQYYPDDIHLVSDFFSALAYRDEVGGRKAKIVTSVAMFYDLEDPTQFMREVYEILADDGIWVTEQSYMPTMIGNGSYDTVCHEHLEYYALNQIWRMADRTGFRVVAVETNNVNGGSFSVTLAKSGIPYQGTECDLSALDLYLSFAAQVDGSRQKLQEFFMQVKAQGKRVLGLGASTKGNIILQYCDITASALQAIGDVNIDKHGCFTPGSRIPILPEDQVLAMKPDYMLVLPWHFRNFFLDNPKYAGFSLVFPLPTLEVFGPRCI